MGFAVGIWQMMEEREIADEQNELTVANLRSQAEEMGRAEGKAKAEKDAASAMTPAKASNPDTNGMIDLGKTRRGVQSSFTATGAGAGNMKGTTLSPLGSDVEEL